MKLKNSSKASKRQNSKENDHTESDDNIGGLSRTSSRAKLDKLKRKVKNALTSNEPGQLPMVQKAKPNPDEYHQFSRSEKNSRNSSFSGSVCISDESLSSPEQQTIAKRPNVMETIRSLMET